MPESKPHWLSSSNVVGKWSRESKLRLLEASLDSVPGFLADCARHAGLTVPEAVRLGDELAERCSLTPAVQTGLRTPSRRLAPIASAAGQE